ncbi:MAG TPA: exodeoxyribonuclease VII large subunit, partial [Acetobacteraceae bacterium]
LIAAARERVRDRSLRLLLALPNLVGVRRTSLHLASQGLLAGLRHAVAVSHNRGHRVLGRLTDSPLRSALREAHARLEGTAARLGSVSPLAVLGRGYALVSDTAGHPLTSAASVKPRARLRLRFTDGEIGATADGGRTDGRQSEFPL